jgi:hypothetical protein
MYDTSGAYSVCNAAPPDNDISVRIAWLKGEVVRAENRAALARAEREWEKAVSMTGPVSTEDSFARFCFWLGLLPPAAIFVRMLNASGFGGGDALHFWRALFLLMNIICCVVGWKFGGYLGRMAGNPRSHEWPAYVFRALLMALLWALVTGGLGGFIGFGIGAVVGVFCALPVALAAFPVFAVLHRIQSHDGMIEARDLRTIAIGIPLTAAALILAVGK